MLLTVKCWKSHALIIFVATLGNMPRFFWRLAELLPSDSSSAVPSPEPMLLSATHKRWENISTRSDKSKAWWIQECIIFVKRQTHNMALNLCSYFSESMQLFSLSLCHDIPWVYVLFVFPKCMLMFSLSVCCDIPWVYMLLFFFPPESMCSCFPWVYAIFALKLCNCFSLSPHQCFPRVYSIVLSLLFTKHNIKEEK